MQCRGTQMVSTTYGLVYEYDDGDISVELLPGYLDPSTKMCFTNKVKSKQTRCCLKVKVPVMRSNFTLNEAGRHLDGK